MAHSTRGFRRKFHDSTSAARLERRQRDNLYHFPHVQGDGKKRGVASRRDPPGQERSFCQGRPKHNHNHNLPKSFASDATPKWHLMAHQMKNSFWFLCVPLCIRAFGVSSGGTQKMKNGTPRDELKMVVVVVGPSLILTPLTSARFATTPSEAISLVKNR